VSLRNRSLRQGNLSLSEALYLGAGWALAVVALPVSLVPGSATLRLDVLTAVAVVGAGIGALRHRVRRRRGKRSQR